MPAIELHNLTKFYGKTKGIQELNLTVEEGEIYGFIGPNGAGKSTTIRAMLDLVHPSSGKALLFGLDSQSDGAEIRQEIGYVPGEVAYYDNMKVVDLLKYSASFYSKNCTKRIKELSEILELDLSRKIDDLSLGNKKKVGIVQGLLHDPKLIILDEPTSGLDPLVQQNFFDLLLAVNRQGTTIFFSSHTLSEVQRICHRVAIVRNGGLAAVENVTELRENNYRKVRAVTKEINRASAGAMGLHLKGVTSFNINDDQIEFLYRGSTNELVETLRRFSLQNLWIEEPTLDEIFLHYYKGGEFNAHLPS